jgi:hypothetical protein
MRTNDWVGKRQAARQPVNMRGEVRFLDGRPPIECLIIDISATGCALDLLGDVEAPEDFDLFIPSRGETKICKIRRNNGQKLGVAFLKSRLDDPLVMQTLLERVGRLERGYAELKGQPSTTAALTGERRASDEPRRADDRELAYAGPSIDNRLQALAAGLADMRATMDAHVSRTAAVAAPVDLTPKVDEQAREIVALKDEMANLAKALRGTTVGDAPDAVTNALDIAKLKSELTELSVAMRNIAALPAMNARAAAPAPVVGAPSQSDTREIAKIRAELSELRALVQVPRDVPVEKPVVEERTSVIKMRFDESQLSQDLDGALANVTERRLGEIAEGMKTLRIDFDGLKETVHALDETVASGEAMQAVVSKEALDALTTAREQAIALGERIDQLDGKVSGAAALALEEARPAIDKAINGLREDFRGALGNIPPEKLLAVPGAIDAMKAALETIRREVTEVRTATRIFDETPAGVGAPVDRKELIKTRVDLSRLREDLDGALANVPQERLMEFADGIGSLRAEVGELREQMRVLGGKAAAEASESSAHAPAADPALAAQIEELRGATKTLILLVSKTLNRLPAPANDQAAA